MPDTPIAIGTIFLHQIDKKAGLILYDAGIDTVFEAALKKIITELSKAAANGAVFKNGFEHEVDERLKNVSLKNYLIEGVHQGVQYSLREFHGAPFLVIHTSPFTGRYTACGPVMPSAGDLSLPDLFGSLCYDIPENWRKNHAHDHP